MALHSLTRTLTSARGVPLGKCSSDAEGAGAQGSALPPVPPTVGLHDAQGY
jgi:hypothetical protein